MVPPHVLPLVSLPLIIITFPIPLVVTHSCSVPLIISLPLSIIGSITSYGLIPLVIFVPLITVFI